MPENTLTVTLERPVHRYWCTLGNTVISIPGRLSVRVEGTARPPSSGN